MSKRTRLHVARLCAPVLGKCSVCGERGLMTHHDSDLIGGFVDDHCVQCLVVAESCLLSAGIGQPHPNLVFKNP